MAARLPPRAAYLMAMSRPYVSAACLAILLAVNPAAAQPPINRPRVEVSRAWARATAPLQDVTAAYFTVRSPAADTLIAITSPDASAAMLHTTTNLGGMADMDALNLPAGQTIRLAPRGMHVMLMGLRHPLVAGGTLRLDFRFAHAGAAHVIAQVLPIGSAGPPP